MSTTHPPSETKKHEASYDIWFRTQVQASINDPRPNIPHDQVMAEMRDLIESKRNKNSPAPGAAMSRSKHGN